MKARFKFTPLGLVAARERRNAAVAALDKLDDENQGVRNGNPAADKYREEKHRLMQTRDEVSRAIANGDLVEPPQDASRLVIGTIGTIQRYDKDENPIGEPTEYLIVGYGETDTQANPKKLAYDSPLLDGLYGQTVDSDREPVPVAGRDFLVGLHAIRLPETSS